MRAAHLTEYHRRSSWSRGPSRSRSHRATSSCRIGGAGVCATDLHAIDGLMEGAGLRPPVVLGHENAGWVDAVGDGVTTAAVGDAVLLYPPYSCGLCVNCRRGLDMHCDRHQFTGLTRDGGFADYVLVDERSLLPLPAGRRAGRGRAPLRRRASPPTTRSRSSSRGSLPARPRP